MNKVGNAAVFSSKQIWTNEIAHPTGLLILIDHSVFNDFIHGYWEYADSKPQKSS